jgi:hypothetical protein
MDNVQKHNLIVITYHRHKLLDMAKLISSFLQLSVANASGNYCSSFFRLYIKAAAFHPFVDNL